MVLDPMTGEMIPDPDAGNEEEWDEEANLSEIQPVTIKLGQLKSKHGSTQDSHSSVPKLKINLGSRIDRNESANNGDLRGSSSRDSSRKHSHKHHKHSKEKSHHKSSSSSSRGKEKSKKSSRHRHDDSDDDYDEDEEIVELSD